jgi:hypothetical protein
LHKAANLLLSLKWRGSIHFLLKMPVVDRMEQAI